MTTFKSQYCKQFQRFLLNKLNYQNVANKNTDRYFNQYCQFFLNKIMFITTNRRIETIFVAYESYYQNKTKNIKRTKFFYV